MIATTEAILCLNLIHVSSTFRRTLKGKGKIHTGCMPLPPNHLCPYIFDDVISLHFLTSRVWTGGALLELTALPVVVQLRTPIDANSWLHRDRRRTRTQKIVDK
jgi:hypothetical protein